MVRPPSALAAAIRSADGPVAALAAADGAVEAPIDGAVEAAVVGAVVGAVVAVLPLQAAANRLTVAPMTSSL